MDLLSGTGPQFSMMRMVGENAAPTTLEWSMTIRRAQLRAIGASVERLTRPIFGKRGFQDASLINKWESVVGGMLAAHTAPEKIAYPRGERRDGTLHLTVDNSAFALELQHLEPQMIDRINTFFGFRAVARIRITQGVIAERPVVEPVVERELSTSERRRLEKRTEIIGDSDLRAALTRLGAAIGGGDDVDEKAKTEK